MNKFADLIENIVLLAIGGVVGFYIGRFPPSEAKTVNPPDRPVMDRRI